MPEPMVPEPTIPTRLMVMELPLDVCLLKGAGQATGGSPSGPNPGRDLPRSREAPRVPAWAVPEFPAGRLGGMNGDGTGTLALVGGAEWQDGCRKFDAALLEAAGPEEVLVLPTAAAFENPRRAVETARRYFDELGANVSGLMALGRTEAEDPTNAAVVRSSRFVY